MSAAQSFHVTGMTCGHCVAAVRAEIEEIDGVRAADVTLETGTVVVHSDAPVTREQVAAAVAEAGYELI